MIALMCVWGNPSLEQSVVDRALARDFASASAEFLGQFRNDIEGYISHEVVSACLGDYTEQAAVSRSAILPSSIPPVEPPHCACLHRNEINKAIVAVAGHIAEQRASAANCAPSRAISGCCTGWETMASTTIFVPTSYRTLPLKGPAS